MNLLWDKAPEICRLVAELASRNEEAGSRFYRNEAVPEVSVMLSVGFALPPYSFAEHMHVAGRAP